jgi:hypothetical protein
MVDTTASAFTIVSTQTNVASVTDCQTLCQNNAQCTVFVYGTNNANPTAADVGKCFLRKAVTAYAISQGYIAGPPTCV